MIPLIEDAYGYTLTTSTKIPSNVAANFSASALKSTLVKSSNSSNLTIRNTLFTIKSLLTSTYWVPRTTSTKSAIAATNVLLNATFVVPFT